MYFCRRISEVRGHKSPILLFMVERSKIESFVNEVIDDNIFIVDIKISTSNKINVLIDSITGTTIKDCITVSRNIENNLDREVEDFELEVSTPGLSEAFKVPQQYEKNLGRQVETQLKDGHKIKGELKGFDGNIIELVEEKMIKPEGEKRKRKVEVNHSINIDDAVSTKVVISFK